MPDLVESMKHAALLAMDNSQPVTLMFGTVVNVDGGLEIQVEQRFTLTEAQLILTRNVTDYDVDVTVEWETENALAHHAHSMKNIGTTAGGDPTHSHSITEAQTLAANLQHNHAIEGRKTMTVHNALQLGESVILIRQVGGQKYLVLDRAVI